MARRPGPRKSALDYEGWQLAAQCIALAMSYSEDMKFDKHEHIQNQLQMTVATETGFLAPGCCPMLAMTMKSRMKGWMKASLTA